MKKTFFLLMLGSLIAFTSCEKPGNENSDSEEKYSEILVSYTDNTVIPTYQEMANSAMELFAVCDAMTYPVSQTSIDSACAKWRQIRVFWEQSEAFLFGPAEYQSLDPHLDSWPLDKNQLDQVLARPDVLEMDAAFARDNLGVSLLGFHAIEYVLFRDGDSRNIADITEAEMVYLKAITEVLTQDCILLEGGWAGKSSLSDAKLAILEDAELDITSNFGNEMKNAGKAGSRYSSVSEGIEEMIEGCKAIADEVGNAKIADPVQSKNVLDVESWYSWNSIDDFIDNIISIQNTYYGTRSGSIAEHSLSKFLAEKNSALDNEIKSKIENAKSKIEAIGRPFRNSLNNEAGAQAAIEACDELYNSLSKIYAELD
ncbi:MAG: peptidase M75 [Bacteroidales bacterium]|jgi:predicted lipoprotein|nr:peptidase M75 [Bacteroidales bacterium]